jgi:hypothetical protein
MHSDGLVVLSQIRETLGLLDIAKNLGTYIVIGGDFSRRRGLV